MWEGDGSHPHSISPGPVAQVLPEGHILPPFTKEDAETQKDYILPVPQTHLLTLVQQTEQSGKVWASGP